MEWSLDYSFILSENVGTGGLGASEMEEVAAGVRGVVSSIMMGREKGEPLFLELPYYHDMADRAVAWVADNRGKFDTFALLGIGGSALGPRALVDALCHPYQALRRDGGMRVFVCDNVDPRALGGILEAVDLDKTVFNVVSKSGGTAEALSLFMVVRERLIRAFGERGCRDRVIFTTDPEKGPLRKIAREEGYRAFEAPPGVGGRYSVLTPVGLLPAAAAGIDVRELLRGAEKVDLLCRSGEMLDNPVALFSAVAHAFHVRKNRNILVMMPYCNGLLTLAEWFQQLWAESLGKLLDLDGKTIHSGSTPVRALGATDQHSQLQLYMEGPDDKLIIFLRVENPESDIAIPPAYPAMDDFGYLGGHTLGELLNAEQEATAAALARNGRPNLTLKIDSLNAEAMGGLFYFLELATAIAGGLYRINPYDQPGVELGKKLTYGMMGKKGAEKLDTKPKMPREIRFFAAK